MTNNNETPINESTVNETAGEIYPCKADIFQKTYTEDKPKTNADRIRSMSNEKLCNWLFQRDCTNIAAFLEYGGMGVMNAVQLLEWLKQPAKGERKEGAD